MPHPKQIETVHVETLEGELCIYDWQRMEVHNLNPTAAAVWNLCDGQTSPQEMAGQLKGDLTPTQAEELVWMSLKRLEKAQLLAANVVKPANRAILTRREMLKGLGVAAMMLPVVSSIVAPSPAAAQSGTGGRFTDNGNGTVTDNQTGLIWLKNANCDGQKNWNDADTWATTTLAHGICSLSDGSKTGDWRLPTKEEWEALVDTSQNNPALPPGHPFTNVQWSKYWSSTTESTYRYNANLSNGEMWDDAVTNTFYVWSVRNA
jgi:hypothetical protein